MENKEIIIDGIDVSKCAYECNGFCTINFEKSNIGMLDCKRCEHYPSCHFKQLKRKEEEVKELNLVNKRLGAELCGKLQNLYRTLDEIKEIAEGVKKDICNNCAWRNTDSCNPDDYTCGEFIKILQKISEVENE